MGLYCLMFSYPMESRSAVAEMILNSASNIGRRGLVSISDLQYLNRLRSRAELGRSEFQVWKGLRSSILG